MRRRCGAARGPRPFSEFRLGHSGRVDPLAPEIDLEDLFRRLPDAVLAVDSSGAIVLASDEAARLFGRPREAMTGLDLEALLGGPVPHAATSTTWRFLTSLPNGQRVEVSAGSSGGGSGGESGGDSYRVAIIRPALETGEGADEDRYLDLAATLADRVREGPYPDESGSTLLGVLCGELGWDVATLWLVSPDRPYLTSPITWPADGGWTEPFEAATRAAHPAMGHGLPGSAWGSRRPMATSVARGGTNLLRQEAMAACGLMTGVAFPLVSDSGTVGVIEMFSRGSAAISVRMLDALAAIGQQIGQRLDQLGIETRLRERERLREFLLEAATSVAGSSDYRDSLRRLAAVSVPEIADLCLIDVLESDGQIVRMAAVHADPAKAGLVEELERSYPPSAAGSHPTVDVMTTGRSGWAAVMPDHYLRATTRDERHFEIVKALGFESYMCVPLRAGDDILGTITLVSAGSGRRFQPVDLALPEELAVRMAVMVAAARRHDQEHEVAQELQRLLLPEHLPVFDGFEMCVRYVAGTQGAAAGGDFYDAVRLPSSRIGLMIGDVEGHDMTAAAIMGQLRSASRALAGQVREPAKLVDALRWSWDLLGFGRIATALFARIDQRSGEVVVASAGHFLPALVDVSGHARFVEADLAPPLGAPGGPAREAHFVLEPGEMLFFFTDGLIEERSVGLEMSLARLLQVLRDSQATELPDVCAEILARFSRQAGRQDDVALLAIRRDPITADAEQVETPSVGLTTPAA